MGFADGTITVSEAEGAPSKRPIHPAFLNAFAFALQDFPGSAVRLLNGNTVSSSIITRRNGIGWLTGALLPLTVLFSPQG